MTRQPNRLPADARHGFGGMALDRSKPLSFRLNGRIYEGFAGDTVLSALLAAGVVAVGSHHGEVIGLGERFAPAVAPARAVNDGAAAMPMDRVPVLAGLDLVTMGPRIKALRLTGVAARLANLMSPTRHSLGHRLDDPRAMEGAWLQLPPVRTIEADTIVVGGGLAGMSAALAAAEAGDRVVLVERRPTLGGDARYFGTVGEEEPPDVSIARLVERIEAAPGITVLTTTEALSFTGNRLRAHRVEVRDAQLASSVVDLKARRVVLATGTAERLPVFPGNRMPGIVGAVAAFHRAERYGVWSGRCAVFATPTNFTYRLALLAADAGIEVQRVADCRVGPQSRFIDFCKASGITLASGLVPRLAESVRREPQALSVGFAVAIEDVGHETAPILTDQLIATGAWQPRLRLWLTAGGQCGYDPARHWIGAEGELGPVALAGAVAGYRSSSACMASGGRAVAALLGRRTPAIEEVAIDAVYESRDAPTPVAPWRAGRIAFLDNGLSFTPRPHAQRKEAQAAAPASLQTLSVSDVAASVELGAIPRADAGIIAAERCLAGGDVADSGWHVGPDASAAAGELPAYLAGRFGPKPQLVVIAAADGRAFETGCLVHASSDVADPFAAIGAVIGPAPQSRSGGLAIANRAALAAAPALFVRDTSGAVAARVVEKLKPPAPAKPA